MHSCNYEIVTSLKQKQQQSLSLPSSICAMPCMCSAESGCPIYITVKLRRWQKGLCMLEVHGYAVLMQNCAT